MTALKQLRFELRDCEVGDYGFDLRGRMDDRYPCWQMSVMPSALEFCDLLEKPADTLPVHNIRVFECGWTSAGIKIWVRVS